MKEAKPSGSLRKARTSQNSRCQALGLGALGLEAPAGACPLHWSKIKEVS